MGIFDISEFESFGSELEPKKSVVVDSYKYVFYPSDKVLVFKGDSQEPSYEVTPVACTCPGDRYSSNPCKHRKAVSELGDGSAVPPLEDTAVRVKESSESEMLFNIDDLLM